MTAGALHGLFISIPINYPLDSLGGDAAGVVHHFHQNKFAVAAVGPVHVQHSMGGGPGTGKRVENDGIWGGCNL